jgi:hypothetical protein
MTRFATPSFAFADLLLPFGGRCHYAPLRALR